jgi:hypothetical protein
MRKGVAYLFRYREVSLAANSRYLDALAEVDDPTDAIQTLDRITTRKQVARKRSVKAFNPVAREDHQLFQVLLNGQHCVRGFSNPDIRGKLHDAAFLQTVPEPKRQSAKVTRLLHRCHAHGLIAKVPFPPLACPSIGTPRHGRLDPAPRNPVSRSLYEACFVTSTLRCKKRRNHR